MAHKALIDAEERMKKAIESTRRELSGIRSGKATPALLDTVRVDAYGSQVPIQQVGTVSVPEPRLIVVQPWDKGLVKAIMKAIQQSDLGLNPTDDGTLIRVPLPSLTEERRKDMVKLVSKLVEEGNPAPGPADAAAMKKNYEATKNDPKALPTNEAKQKAITEQSKKGGQ